MNIKGTQLVYLYNFLSSAETLPKGLKPLLNKLKESMDAHDRKVKKAIEKRSATKHPQGYVERSELTNPFIISFDGGCEPVNPGGVAIAAFIVKSPNGDIVHQEARETVRGMEATNNIAEWNAAFTASEWVKDNIAGKDVIIRGDSAIVINSLISMKSKGKFQAVSAQTKVNLACCKWTCYHIPREQNGEADKLARDHYKTLSPWSCDMLDKSHWTNEPATKKQLNYLRSLKVYFEEPLTKGQANKLIASRIS